MAIKGSSRSDVYGGMRTDRIRQIERGLPVDTISDLCFACHSPILCATSWDGSATVWEFSPNYKEENLVTRRPPAAPKIAATTSLTGRAGSSSLSSGAFTSSTFSRTTGLSSLKPAALLRCCFRNDDEMIYFGDSYGFIHQWRYRHQNAADNPCCINQVAEMPIVGLRWCGHENCLLSTSVSADGGQGTVTIWRAAEEGKEEGRTDIRVQGKPVYLDTDPAGTMVFVATLDGAQPRIWKIASPFTGNSRPQQIETALGYQITSLAVGPHGELLAGSILGEVEISAGAQRLKIEVHRDSDRGTQTREVNVWASNRVAVSTTNPWGLSAGGDGSLVYLNFTNGRRGRVIQVGPNRQCPLTAVAISHDSEVAALAQGYDWQVGANAMFEMGADSKPPVDPVIWIKLLEAKDFG